MENRQLEHRKPVHKGYEYETIPDDDYWQKLGTDILKAALIAAIGVLVREVIVTVEGRSSRSSSPYEE